MVNTTSCIFVITRVHCVLNLYIRRLLANTFQTHDEPISQPCDVHASATHYIKTIRVVPVVNGELLYCQHAYTHTTGNKVMDSAGLIGD